MAMPFDRFITIDFLLDNEAAEALYHDYAAAMPIIDYHSHLSAADIANDRQFENLTQIWLAEDHYKWRAMRANGIHEHFITGSASDWEKFARWAETVPATLRNPLYHWTHLELKHPFGIGDRLLDETTATEIWRRGEELLAQPEFRTRALLERARVEALCTTDDPADSLEAHARIAKDDSFPMTVLPTWRPDRALAVDDADAFNAWLDRLGAAADMEIAGLDDYRRALAKRHDVFHAHGCRLSDHGMARLHAVDPTESELRRIFGKARDGQSAGPEERAAFQTAMLIEFARMDHAKGWVQQYHFGALRNTRTRLWEACGPDAGGDSIGDAPVAEPLAWFLDRLDQTGQLAPTVLYNNNPRDNAVTATLIGSFQDGALPGKMQWGPAWWHLDQQDGIEAQLNTLSAMGLLRRFIGMTTDSRSLLSFSRHEYFRRILCNLLGADVEAGRLPRDLERIGALVKDVCADNARRYFGF